MRTGPAPSISPLTTRPSACRNLATLMLKLVGVIVALVTFASPLAAGGHQAGAPVRIGVLSPLSRGLSVAVWESFSQGLHSRR
jgi:hypothetical protein